MINILNNKLKFKERYLSFQTNSNVNPRNIKNLLNNRINSLYSVSNYLNKLSISSPNLVFKGLPFLRKGISITETDKLLKLSPLSRKGLDLLNIAPKTKSSFLYPNSKLSKNISATPYLSFTSQTEGVVAKPSYASATSLSTLSLSPKLLGPSGSFSLHRGAAPLRTRGMRSTPFSGGPFVLRGISHYHSSSCLHATFLLCSSRLSLLPTGIAPLVLPVRPHTYLEERSNHLLKKGEMCVAFYSTEVSKPLEIVAVPAVSLTLPAKGEGVDGLDLKDRYKLPLILPIKEEGKGPKSLSSSRFALLRPSRPLPLPRLSVNLVSGASLQGAESLISFRGPNGIGEGDSSYGVYKPLSLALYLEDLSISQSEFSTRLGLVWCPSVKNLNDGIDSVQSLRDAEDLKKDIEDIKRERAIRKWRAACKKKNKQLIKLGAYTPQVSDKNWFTFLDKLRQIIKSKHTFNSLLSRSQSVSYYFNKDYKKTNFNSIYKILKYFFTSLSALISNPVFQVTPEKVNIRLFYFKIPTVSTLKKERKARNFIRKTGILEEDKKNRFNLRKIMQKVRMKLFIAKWKESNNLVRLPRLPEAFSNLRAAANPSNHSSATFPTNFGTKNAAFAYAQPIGFEERGMAGSKTPQGALDLKSRLIPASLSSGTTRASHLKEDINTENLTAQVMSITPNRFILKDLNPFNPLLHASSSTYTPKARMGVSGETYRTAPRPYGKGLSPSTVISLNIDKLKYLVFILEKAFKKTVILDLVRLKYPYHDSNILAQVLGLNSNRRNFRQMMRKLLYTATIKNPTKMIRKQNFSIIPSYLSGIKIRLAGRLVTQRVVPRFTVQSIQMGSLARGKINYVDSSRLTLKNKRGAFSFTVSTSHIFEG